MQRLQEKRKIRLRYILILRYKLGGYYLSYYYFKIFVPFKTNEESLVIVYIKLNQIKDFLCIIIINKKEMGINKKLL